MSLHPLLVEMADLKQELETATPEEPLWGHFLYKGAVTLLVAPSSAGKTVFTHRLAQCLAAGQAFLGMAPPGPVRIVHFDVESPRAAKQSILEVMDPPKGWLAFKGTTPTEIRHFLSNESGHDLYIVDNLQMVFPTKDEQDNSEAIMQITFFTLVAKEKNVSILLVYNTGKASENPMHRRAPDDTYLARGASARVERADLVLNMVKEDEDDTYALHLVKDRVGHKGESLVYSWAPDYNYKLLGHTYPNLDRESMMAQAILKQLEHGEPVSRATLWSALEITRKSARERMAERALAILAETGQVVKAARGTYQLPT